MPLYTVYATEAQLAAYLGVDVGDLPTDAERQLTRASEMVKQATLNNIDEDNEDHVEVAQLATCAQVEYWISQGEDMSTSPGYKKLKIDKFEVEFSGSGGSANTRQLATRAKNYLSDYGLMYRGVKLNASTNDLTN